MTKEFINPAQNSLQSNEVKNPPAKAGDTDSIPSWGRSPGEGNGNPLQYSCLENPMDRGAWWTTVRGVSRVRYNGVNKHTHTLPNECLSKLI